VTRRGHRIVNRIESNATLRENVQDAQCWTHFITLAAKNKICSSQVFPVPIETHGESMSHRLSWAPGLDEYGASGWVQLATPRASLLTVTE
jgi:hypothetical protein